MPETERKELRLITKIQKYYCHDIENRIPHGTGIKNPADVPDPQEKQ